MGGLGPGLGSPLNPALGLLLRHFSIVFNGTTATAAVRSQFVCSEKAGQLSVSFESFYAESKLELDLMQRKICQVQAFGRSSGYFNHGFEFVPV